MLIRTFLGLFLLASPAVAQELTDDTYEKCRDHILPSKEEMKWRSISWRPTFWEAVVEAQKKEMPILLWAMNGHPLACT